MTDPQTDPPADLTTRLIHHPYRAPEGFEAVPVAVHKASTVIFRDVAALRARDWRHKTGYTYGLHGTPTTFTLEERIATIDGGRQALLQPSGLAAITLVNLAVLEAGDEVLLPENVYGPSLEQARSVLARMGVRHRVYDPMHAASFAAMLSANTKLVWLEAPGSVTMEFPDLRALVRAVRSTSAICALDNTWGAGIAFNPFDLGDGLAVDISMHALTKYPSGGADVLMGSLTTVDDALHETLARAHMHLGIGVSANDAEAVLRSLPTMALRYRAHDRTAREVATWLRAQSAVMQVLHPAMPGSPGHMHWSMLCSDAAGLFSVVFDPAIAPARIDAFVDALRIFRIGFSWGGPVSLVVPYDAAKMRSPASRPGGHLVRFAIGLESADALVDDLKQAFGVFAG
jgi:cysteine-S-conjugate beta-lyase